MIVGQSIADGQLPSSTGTLYTVPANTVAHITNIVLANTSASVDRTYNLYVKRSGGTSRRIVGADTPLRASKAHYLPPDQTAIRLSAGDVIEGDADAATAIDYLITGGLEAV